MGEGAETNPVTRDQQAGEHKLVPGEFVLPSALVAFLFFLWGIPNNLNDILIRQFMKSFEITRFKAGLIQSVFYLGYFLISLPAARRLNFAQAFNPFGAITGALGGTIFIFSGIELSDGEIAAMKAAGSYVAYLRQETLRVAAPYIVLGCVALAWALPMSRARFPAIGGEGSRAEERGAFRTLFRHRAWRIADRDGDCRRCGPDTHHGIDRGPQHGACDAGSACLLCVHCLLRPLRKPRSGVAANRMRRSMNQTISLAMRRALFTGQDIRRARGQLDFRPPAV